MIEGTLNHPGDEALRALSLGQLTEAELGHISAHLSDCPACCGRIDQLASDDHLVARLQQSAASRENVLVGRAQRRSAVRALRRSDEDSSAERNRNPDASTVSGLASASDLQSDRDASPSKGLPDDLKTFLAPPEWPDEIGRLGPYRILAVLGHGGMGVVFRAHDPALDRMVALKAMLPGMAAVPTARDRFLREAKAAAGLKHPHIVTVFHVGEDCSAPFLAMEFLEGEPLDDRIRREGRLPLAEVVRIGRETALGLAAAHARGLVHRDIKPANLWLEGPTGHVKILDFGLAHAVADQTQLTQFGLILGTPAYMAPEQAEGKRVDPRWDLFSLGCVLYQMSTGMLPYRGETTIAVLRALALHEPPPVGEVRPEAPGELSALVARLLAKKPEDRPASAQEVAETLHDVEQLSTTQSLPKPAASPGRKRRQPLVAVAGAALAVALALIVVLWPTPRGTVRIESDDPAVEVVFDKDGPTIKGANQKPITLRAGEHGVRIQRGDFVFDADKLVLKKEAALTLKVELLKGKVQVMQDGRVLATQAMPLPAGVLEAKRTPDGYTNSLGMDFVRVPKGKAWLGGGEGRPGEKKVDIGEDFYLGQYEVTQEEWEKVMGTNSSYFSRSGGGKQAVRQITDDELKRFPVENVTKTAVQKFLQKLNQREHDTGWTYRLPTAVEWEYACRGGPMADPAESAFDFYLGEPTNLLPPDQANIPGANALGRTCRVGSYEPNRLGLYDMHGNVHEFCDDKVRRPDGHWEVLGRGGGHNGDPLYCRTKVSSSAMPWYWSRNLGLRVGRFRAPAASVPATQDGRVATEAVPPPPAAKAPFDAHQADDHQVAWANYLGVSVETENSLGMKLRLIPPGEFTMGATDAEEEAWPKIGPYPKHGRMAIPAHPVRLTRPFYMAQREVRYRDFLNLMKREPGHEPKSPHNAPDGVLLSRCTWFDCIEFCNRLSEQEELTPAYKVAGQTVTVIPEATGYRLPTEAEWEFACRAGTSSLWYFGLTAQEAQAKFARGVLEAEAYLRARTATPNPFGLLGMYGGSSEWCWDRYSPGYYEDCASRGVVVDPQGPDAGEARVTRGGTYFANAGGDMTLLNSAARNPADPKTPFGLNGFGRLVLPVPAKGQTSWIGPIQDP